MVIMKGSVHLTPCSQETPKRVIGKQCRHRSDAAEHDKALHCLQIVYPFSLGISKSQLNVPKIEIGLFQ